MLAHKTLPPLWLLKKNDDDLKAQFDANTVNTLMASAVYIPQVRIHSSQINMQMYRLLTF